MEFFGLVTINPESFNVWSLRISISLTTTIFILGCILSVRAFLYSRRVDAAYLDGTFYDGAELPGRAMSEIPHPFISESLTRFASLPASERAKIVFIHLNHTNPAATPGSAAQRVIARAGLRVAVEGERRPL